MTSPNDESPVAEPSAATAPAWPRFVRPAIAALLFLLVFLAVRSIVRAFDPFGMRKARAGETAMTQAVIVGKMRTVAQLVTNETTVRDVVTYENRRLGSTKRALVVVTGRILAGIDLDRGTEVAIDHEKRKVRIELPRAGVLAVEITEMRTWDEQNGILNRFRPADRDTIFAIARRQLAENAAETGALAHADTSAKRLLEALVATDGYTTEVVFRGARRSGDDAGVPLR